MTQNSESARKSPAVGILWHVVRIALAVAPIIWIYAHVDAAAFEEVTTSVSVPIVAAILSLSLFCIALQGVKWWVLIRRFVPELKLGKAVSVHFESVFYAIMLPSGIAQDIVKSVILSKTHSPAAVWAASWCGRLIGLFVLLLCSIYGILSLGSDTIPAGFRISLLVAIAAVAALSAASFSKKVTRPFSAVAAKIAPQKILTDLKKLRDGIYAFRNERMVLAQTFLISVIIHFLILFFISLTVYAISGKFYFLECLAFVPLVEIIVITLPLTPGGIGIREALMALLFTQIGFSNEQIAMYVTISLLVSMTKVVGGVLPLWRKILKALNFFELKRPK